MSRKIALITLLSLVFAHTTAAAPGIVELALQGIGGGSPAEMKGRIFSVPFSVYAAADNRRAIASLTQWIRESRISRGELWRRVESVMRPVLELHNRSDKIELFLYHDHVPRATVWQGCVLVMSDALADPLNDDQLAGVIAHEMAHAYFMIETIKARQHGDTQALRIVELKCDAVAMLTLKLMDRDPADYVRALRRISDITNGFVRIDSHPSLREREVFAQRFIKLLA